MNSARFSDIVPLLSNMDLQGTAGRAAAFLEEILPLTGLDLTVHVDAPDPVHQAAGRIRFEGPDMPRMLAGDGELLCAIEHLTAEVLRLDLEQRHSFSLDGGDFGEARQRWIEGLACSALARVRHTGQPYEFPPMNPYERQLLHLALEPSGLVTKSAEAGAARHVVLHPKTASTRMPRHRGGVPGYLSH